VLLLMLSMKTSQDEGKTLGHLEDCMDHHGESSMKIALPDADSSSHRSVT
jgi:hypothetical protein